MRININKRGVLHIVASLAIVAGCLMGMAPTANARCTEKNVCSHMLPIWLPRSVSRLMGRSAALMYTAR